VNNLTAIALTTGKVRLESDGIPWRPLVHIEDISRAFLAMLEAPRELVHNEAFNVGRPEDNVQIRDIAEQVRETVSGSEVTFAANAGPDLRNYRTASISASSTIRSPSWTCGGRCATGSPSCSLATRSTG
jgi:nucleoside-diphosphate-sugar epimerase